MTPSEIRAYYSRPEILARLFEMSRGREVIPVFRDGIYGRRPNSVQFPADILYFAKNGAVSFHCSVEHWKNPSALSNDLKRKDLDALRTGWDFVLDIDSDAGIEVAKITAKLLIEEMQKNGVKNISVKFSGRRGFHIGVAWGAFSGTKVIGVENIAKMFPELPQKIAAYLCGRIKDGLSEKILLADSSLAEKMKDASGGLNPYNIVEVEQNWSVRHLFRMPYAFNDKTWNVSLPIDPLRIMEFSPDEAMPEKVTAKIGFLEKYEEGECETLLKNALEFEKEKKEKVIENKITEKEKGVGEGVLDVILKEDKKKKLIDEIAHPLKSHTFVVEDRALDKNKDKKLQK